VLGAARVQWVCRLNMFFAGQGTLCLLHAAAAKVLQAELAICSSDAERRLTLDRHWARLWRIEDIEWARYEAGRVPYKDYMASKYERLATELALQRLGRA